MKSRAFTLVELLAVIAIVGVLATILFVALGKARQYSQQATCASNVRQIGLAILLYANDNKGQAPVAVGSGNVPGMPGTDGQCAWIQYLADGGYITDYKVYNCDAQAPKRAYNLNYKQIVIDYGANFDLLGRTEIHFTRIISIKNPATVPLAGDSAVPLFSGITDVARARLYNAKSTGWSPPVAIDPTMSRHPGGSNVCFADGHTAMVSQQTIYNGTGGNAQFNFRPDGT